MKPLRVARSLEEEELAVAEQFCECAGALWIKKRHVRERDGQIVHDLELECEVCFQSQQCSFLFTGDKNADDAPQSESSNDFWEDDDEDDPRPHHYLFAHRVLPQIVFDDAATFFEVMRQGQSAPVLEDIWHRVGSETGQPIITANGLPALTVRSHQFLGRPGIVVQLPQPKAMLEAWYVVIIADDKRSAEPWRYLVFENTNRVDENPQAVLCEWFEDGSRQNHRQTGIPTFETMISAVERHLTLEEKRRHARMDTDVSPRWQPGENPGGPSEWDTGFYRLPICKFAFQKLPKILARDPRTVVRAFQLGQAAALVKSLWSGYLDEADGQKIAIRTQVVNGDWYAVIKMPEPLAPPEPYLIGFALPQNIKGPPRIYTLEMASVDGEALPLFCSINPDGAHGIVGELINVNPDEFAQIIALAEHQQLPRLNPGNTLMHLVLYAEIANRE